MSFELTFLGASGGPIELGTCGLMLKPANVSYQEIIDDDHSNPLLMIDGGSGAYALAEIIRDASSVLSRLLLLYPDSLEVRDYFELDLTHPFRSVEDIPLVALKKIFGRLKSMLLTHPHLDHILALVINLAGFPVCNMPRKLTVYGSDFTVGALRKHVFNGIIWPDLTAANLFDFQSIPFKLELLLNNDYYTVTMMELSHGHLHLGAPGSIYPSLAFLVRDNTTDAKILVFGDFEADLVLGTNINRQLWKHVAPFILDGSLKAVVLECSSLTVASGTELYGHLMPPHLISEMKTLASLCLLQTTNKPLDGLQVIVTHVKESDFGDPRRKILHELRELNEKSGLGLRVSIAVSGVLVVV